MDEGLWRQKREVSSQPRSSLWQLALIGILISFVALARHSPRKYTEENQKIGKEKRKQSKKDASPLLAPDRQIAQAKEIDDDGSRGNSVKWVNKPPDSIAVWTLVIAI